MKKGPIIYGKLEKDQLAAQRAQEAMQRVQEEASLSWISLSLLSHFLSSHRSGRECRSLWSLLAAQRAQEAMQRVQEEAAEREAKRKIYRQDPTIPAGEADARVSRDEAGKTTMEQSIIRWYFDSDPRGIMAGVVWATNMPFI